MDILKLMEKAPAKINLALDVLFKRPDGYHEVEMIMTTVDLADRIELKEIKEIIFKFYPIIDLFRMITGI